MTAFVSERVFQFGGLLKGLFVIAVTGHDDTRDYAEFACALDILPSFPVSLALFCIKVQECNGLAVGVACAPLIPTGGHTGQADAQRITPIVGEVHKRTFANAEPVNKPAVACLELFNERAVDAALLVAVTLEFVTRGLNQTLRSRPCGHPVIMDRAASLRHNLNVVVNALDGETNVRRVVVQGSHSRCSRLIRRFLPLSQDSNGCIQAFEDCLQILLCPFSRVDVTLVCGGIFFACILFEIRLIVGYRRRER